MAACGLGTGLGLKSTLRLEKRHLEGLWGHRRVGHHEVLKTALWRQRAVQRLRKGDEQRHRHMVLVAQHERGAVLFQSMGAGGPNAGQRQQHPQQASPYFVKRCHDQRQ
jgi:hypothetical protein